MFECVGKYEIREKGRLGSHTDSRVDPCHYSVCLVRDTSSELVQALP